MKSKLIYYYLFLVLTSLSFESNATYSVLEQSEGEWKFGGFTFWLEQDKKKCTLHWRGKTRGEEILKIPPPCSFISLNPSTRNLELIRDDVSVLHKVRWQFTVLVTLKKYSHLVSSSDRCPVGQQGILVLQKPNEETVLLTTMTMYYPEIKCNKITRPLDKEAVTYDFVHEGIANMMTSEAYSPPTRKNERKLRLAALLATLRDGKNDRGTWSHNPAEEIKTLLKEFPEKNIQLKTKKKSP